MAKAAGRDAPTLLLLNSAKIMLEQFLAKTQFESYEDFMANFKVNVPEDFNFGYDVVDRWAETEPDKKA